jgi:hypothetical protein
MKSIDDIYIDHIKNRSYWKDTAEKLKFAAYKIFEVHQNSWRIALNLEYGQPVAEEDDAISLNMFPIYKMLMGYALENAIKGFIIYKTRLQDPKFFDNKDFKNLRVPRKGGKGDVNIFSHELENLFEAEVVNIILTGREKKVLEDIESHVKWKGKYHIPKGKPDREFIDHWIDGDLGEGVYETVNAIYNKTIAELDKLELPRVWFKV